MAIENRKPAEASGGATGGDGRPAEMSQKHRWLVFGSNVAVAVLLGVFGRPDYGPIASGYLGLVLLGALYVAVGVFASSLTSNQVIAAVVGFVILIMLALLGPWVSTTLPSDWHGIPWRGIVQQASVKTHYTDFSQGVVDATHVVYFLALALYALFLTVKVLESRRWR